ncbi:winged helix-turn-helix transcriptional regulator [Haloarcula salinisoli]|uniref:Helix-turn-helix transcriptional regulator n=1 Tax=Haloarcula salinisoli TaxID=2487746 RepID=A0A8J7YMY4_9EURY|nr:helix-turn-helix domain-containing protein [Halomicroarcula salinisoli]MBX0286846.1 helix-turn-helix transcriptional regulator [Halomicroarcula salinisoli]MBX0304148.1 helix-turn-helix transcriptional regulator [Halomicroarcula salinisoli]
MAAETSERQASVERHNESACPVVQAVDSIGTPWRLNVVYALRDGEKRFNELKESTDARSKTLSDALEPLVEDDIVDRRMEEAAPVAVFYRLTPKGRELLDVLDELDDWARRWDDVSPPAGGRLREDASPS